MPLTHNYPVGKLSWFRTSGIAENFFKADTLEELIDYIKELDGNFHILGNGSNTLIRDGGVSVPIIKLGKAFRKMTCDDIAVTLGAACLNRMVVEQTLAWSLSGLEFLVGIPGSIGGAVAMNAGACGFETKDSLSSIRIIDQKGTIKTIQKNELSMSYRHTQLPSDAIVIDATFNLRKEKPDMIKGKINEYLNHRDEAQPAGGKTGGSTFKNPEDQSAWKLIDEVGLRNHKIGSAQFSDKHCNFILNDEQGDAESVEQLGELARKKVKDKFDIDLQWEIKRIGKHLKSNESNTK